MKYLLTLLWLLGAIAAQAQEYTGHVADKEDGAPVAGAIVTARDSLGKPLGYTTTSASGDFVLRPRGGGTTAQLDFSTMGYRRQSIPADAGRMLVLLTPEATGIREVTIRAPRLSFRGDTVSYNVSRFTEAQDRSIADVLRKMPGIEVAKSGEIRYNGQPINNFYIEGLDMLDGRYGQATNNIAPQDVASVEVMENHQPIKALKDIVFSDRAAINLRLKPHAKARWTGTLRGGAGWSPALWNGALFAMRIGARGQSMVNLKTDNTGQNPSAETERLSVEDILNGGANDYNPAAHLSVGTSSAPLDDTRTRFNRSHMASLNNLRKLSEDYQLSSSLTWGYDRLASDRAARQSWYLADGTRVDTEQESAASCRQQLSARIALKANTERFYMLEKLEASLAWNDLRAVLSGSYPNRQRAEAPAYGIENDLKYIRRTGTRSLTVTSYLKYLTRPQSLDVVRETGSQRQTIADRAFYMNHNAAFGTQAGQFAFAFKGGVSALFRGLVTDLTGTGLGTGAANDLSAGYAGVYLQPGITYRSQRLRLTLDLPAGYRRYGLHDRIDGNRNPAGIFTWKPRFAVKWSPTGHLSLSASGTVGRDAADDSRIGNGAVLRNYRSVLCGVNEYRQALQRSLSAGIAYKNPIGGFFASLLAVRSWNDLPFLPAQRFDGDYIVNYYVHSSNHVRSWYLSGDVSQNIDALNGQAGLNVGYNLSGTELLLEEVPASCENSTLTVAPRFNFRFAAWVNTEYRLEYRYTTLSIRGREPDGRHDFNQRLTVNLVPSKKWVIQFTAEHYYSQLSADRSKHLLLADASLRWKINGKWESYGDRRKPFRPRRICLYDLRRSKLELLPLCHPPAQYPAGRKLEILTTAARRNARASPGLPDQKLRPASHHRRVPPWSPPPSSATSAAYCSGSDVASAAGNGSRRIIVSVSI